MTFLLILFWLGVGMAVKSAIDDVKTHFQKSRSAALDRAAERRPDGKLSPTSAKAVAGRHALGWWARELAQGFPVILGGLAAGWHAHRAAQQEIRTQQIDAQTQHIEGKAGLAELIRQHRARQAAARARLRGGGGVERDPANPPRPQTFSDPAPTAQPAPADPPAEPPSPNSQPEPPSNAEPPADPWTPDPAWPWAAPVVDPHPPDSSPADSAPNGRNPMPKQDANTAPAETTYDQLLTQLNKSIVRTEIKLQELRLEQWKAMADDLVGALRDAKTVGNLHSAAEAVEKEIKATQETLESLIATRRDLKHDHGGLNEAHQNAPVPGAHPTFYNN